MRIGIDASRSSRRLATGTERYSYHVTCALAGLGSGHQFEYYVRPGLAQALPQGAQGIPLSPSRLWTHVGLGRQLWRDPPDALFVPAHVLPIGQALRKTTRCVVTVHDLGFRHFPEAHPLGQRLYLALSTRLSARVADTIVTDSGATRDDLVASYGIAREKIRVAYPGADDDQPANPPKQDAESDSATDLCMRLNLPPDAQIVLCIGTLQPRKNVTRLLHAWLSVQQAWHGAGRPVLVLAGKPGWGREDYPQIARQLGIADAVRFSGYISDAERAGLLRRARALVFPSLYEGFGFPVLEAQRAGVPVVCSASSSLPEVAGDGAVLVDPLDAGAIAQGLRDALTNEPLRTRLIAAGRLNAQRFTWRGCARVIMSALEAAA